MSSTVLAGLACTPEPEPPEPVLVGGTAKDGQTGDPIEGAEVCITFPADLGCATSDADGYAELEVPALVDAFDIRLEAEDYFDTISYGFTTDEDNTDLVLQLVHHDSAPLLEFALGVDRDPTKGLISFFAKKEGGGGAAGVSVSVSPASGELFYLNSNSLAEPNAGATVETGVAIIVNAEPGNATFSAIGPCESLFTYAGFEGTQEVVVEPDTLTFVGLLCEDP